jgi:hypothetical protein
MYSGTLINDLFGLVDRKKVDQKSSERAESERSPGECTPGESAHVDSRSPGVNGSPRP